MAESQANRKATLKYRKEKTKSITLTFYPSDMALYDFVSAQGSKATYLKGLIREAMEAQKMDEPSDC